MGQCGYLEKDIQLIAKKLFRCFEEIYSEYKGFLNPSG